MPELLARFQMGAAKVRATAAGRRQWTRLPPPEVREITVGIERAGMATDLSIPRGLTTHSTRAKIARLSSARLGCLFGCVHGGPIRALGGYFDFRRI
jgi:hypothetical protein